MKKSRFLSFSLPTLFFLTAIIALSLSLRSVYQENALVQKRYEELAGATGIIPVESIVDPKLIYFRELDQPAKLAWSFQIYIPDEQKMKLNIGEGVIPDLRSYPPIVVSEEFRMPNPIFFPESQRSITVYVFYNKQRDTREAKGWWVCCDNPGGRRQRCVGEDRMNWLDRFVPQGRNVIASDSRRIRSGSTTDKVVLLRISESDCANFKSNKTPRDFMIWLEPVSD